MPLNCKAGRLASLESVFFCAFTADDASTFTAIAAPEPSAIHRAGLFCAAGQLRAGHTA